MILFIPLILALIVGWVVYSFPQLLAFSAALSEWCQSLFLQCLEKLFMIKILFVWTGFILIAVWFMHALLKAVFVLVKTQKQIKGLPLIPCGDMVIIKDDTIKTAFTHGFFRPKVYISTGLMDSLDRSELRAVYLHELHHKTQRDPLRLFLISILKDAFLYIPISRFIARFVHNKIEVQADNAVVSTMREPLSLANALLKIAGYHKNSMMLQPASIKGFGSIEERVRRLIEGTEERIHLPALKTIMMSIVISVFLTFSLTFPLVASLSNIGQCTTDHCAIHINTLGEDCKTHCESSGHYH